MGDAGNVKRINISIIFMFVWVYDSLIFRRFINNINLGIIQACRYCSFVLYLIVLVYMYAYIFVWAFVLVYIYVYLFVQVFASMCSIEFLLVC